MLLSHFFILNCYITTKKLCIFYFNENNCENIVVKKQLRDFRKKKDSRQKHVSTKKIVSFCQTRQIVIFFAYSLTILLRQHQTHITIKNNKLIRKISKAFHEYLFQHVRIFFKQFSRNSNSKSNSTKQRSRQ